MKKLLLASSMFCGLCLFAAAQVQRAEKVVYPAALAELIGGRGCVVRHGYMVYFWGDQTKSYDVASAMKSVLSTLPFIAIQEGKLNGVNAQISNVEPRLKSLNDGKDAASPGGISRRKPPVTD